MDSGRAFCEQRHDLRKYNGWLLVRSLRLNTGLKKLQKYSAGRRILNYILGVWKGDENPVSRVWFITWPLEFEIQQFSFYFFISL